VTEFCFGQYYLSTRNPQEAEGHYRLAMQELSALEEWPRAIRAGFNLQAVAMNLNRLDEGLSMNDTTAALVQLLEKRNGKPHIPNRYRQTRYRFVLLQRLGRLKEARPLKDSLLSYAAILNDPSQDGVIYTALAQYEQLTGNKEEAYAMLDTLIQRSKRSGNWTTTARYRLSLADFQQDNKDYEQAVVNYRLYAAENDSAQVQHTNEQINELTKRFELRQLKQETRPPGSEIPPLRRWWAFWWPCWPPSCCMRVRSEGKTAPCSRRNWRASMRKNRPNRCSWKRAPPRTCRPKKNSMPACSR
jgi:tetratricopeptide (TPR) repeat protein